MTDLVDLNDNGQLNRFGLHDGSPADAHGRAACAIGRSSRGHCFRSTGAGKLGYRAPFLCAIVRHGYVSHQVDHHGLPHQSVQTDRVETARQVQGGCAVKR